MSQMYQMISADTERQSSSLHRDDNLPASPKASWSSRSTLLKDFCGILLVVHGAAAALSRLALGHVLGSLFPADLNVSVGIVIAGIGLLGISRQPRVVRACGLVLIALFSLDVLEYLLRSHSNAGLTGVDPANTSGALQVAGTFRTAVVSLIIAGLAFLASDRPRAWTAHFIALAAFLPVSTAAAVLAGSMFGPMARLDPLRVSPAGALDVLSLGIGLFAVAAGFLPRLWRPWLPLVGTATLACGAALLWNGLISDRDARMLGIARTVASNVAAVHSRALRDIATELALFGDGLTAACIDNDGNCEQQVASVAHFKRYPGLIAYGLVNGLSGSVFTADADRNGVKFYRAANLVRTSCLSAPFQTGSGEPLSIRGVLNGHATFTLIVPGMSSDRLYWACFQLEDLVRYTTEPLRGSRFAMRVNFENTEALPRSIPTSVSTSVAIEKTRLFGSSWTFEASPSGRPVSRAGSTDFVLLAGIMVAFLFGISFYLWETSLESLQALGDARQAAESANVAKSSFLARMSHEIRTPMNSISAMADLLSETTLDDKQSEYVRVFRSNIQRLLRLINDILDFSKVESGALTLDRSVFSLNNVLEQVMELLGPVAYRKNIELIYSVARDVPDRLTGDEQRLDQVLINLVGNSIKFTDAGEVVVRVTREESEISTLHFEVSDTGSGIPPDRLGHVFDVFAQIDSSITRKMEGTGLGLAISKKIIEAMGGRIWVDSDLGHGSAFSFTARLEHPTDEEEPVSVISEIQGRNVLVISESATNRMVLRESLTAWGALVNEIDAPSTLPASSEHTGARYDVILVDCGVGGDLARVEATRQQTDFGNARVIAVISDSFAKDLSSIKRARVDAFLIKPIRRSKLLEVLQGSGRSPKTSEHLLPIHGMQRVEPLTILVAEDVSDNQFVIKAFLEDQPHDIAFADDGQTAVEMAQTNRYDLILMDLQMPVMDGYTAVRYIREWEQKVGRKRVPILALTAHTMPSEVTKSLEAGCTGHLNKPFRKSDLLQALSAHHSNGDGAPQGPSRKQAHVPAVLKPAIPRFLDEREHDLASLLSALNQSDFALASNIGHKLKGTGGTYGFPDITQSGAVIEEAAAHLDDAVIRTEVAALREYLSSVEIVYEEAKRQTS